MENAVDALKIAFAVMVFTMALTLAISTFSQARETSEAILFMNDKTNYYSWEDAENYAELDADGNIIEYKSQRIVGIDAIIPTLYRYYKENYTVIFDIRDDSECSFYNVKITTKADGTQDKKWSSRNSTSDNIYSFDLNSEIQANCPWVGTVNDIKKNLDLFLDGTPGYSFGNESRKVVYKGFIKEYANATFLEQLGEYATDRNYGIKTDADGNKWVVVGSNKYPYDSTTGRVEGQKISDFLEGKGVIINSTTTKIDDDSGEIIELAKPKIKRVIKYTLINNP